MLLRFQRLYRRGSKQIAVIYDRTGMTKDNRDPKLTQFSLKFAGMMQDYYAERLSRLYVINANQMY